MTRTARIAAIVGLGFALIACVPEPPADPSPATIAGSGVYAFEFFVDGALVASGSHSATFALTRSGSSYTGTAISADPGPQTYAELTFSGQDFTHVYTRAVGDPPGVGYEMDTDSVSATIDDSGTVCVGSALVMNVSGALTLDGVPGDYATNGVWTICDPIAAAYFG